ncbi:MAG: glutathione S-transferase [Rheinheimera sp.]|nr:MAG: glutathione S-transferase [Rheinheimera sp.]
MITALYAAVLAVMFVGLALAVVRQRFKLRVGLGDGQQPELIKAIRIHGNFAEYVPFLLVLMFIAEQQQAAAWQIHLLGVLTVGGRLLHLVGLRQSSGTSIARFFGMISTFAALLCGAAFLLLPL